MVADLIQFPCRQPRVGDDGPGVEPAHREQQSCQRDAVFADNHHPVARSHSKRGKDGGDLGDMPVQIAIAPGRPVLDQRDPVRGFGSLPGRYFMDAIGRPTAISSRSIASRSSVTTDLRQTIARSRNAGCPPDLTFFFRTRQDKFPLSASQGPKGQPACLILVWSLLKAVVYNVPSGRYY